MALSRRASAVLHKTERSMLSRVFPDIWLRSPANLFAQHNAQKGHSALCHLDNHIFMPFLLRFCHIGCLQH